MEEKRYLYDRIEKKNMAKTIWIIVACAFMLTEIILCMHIYNSKETTMQNAKETYEENVKIKQEILALSVKDGEGIDYLKKLRELATNYEIKEKEGGKIILSYDYSTNGQRVELTLDEDFNLLNDNLLRLYSVDLVDWRDYTLTILGAVIVAAGCGAVVEGTYLILFGISYLCKSSAEKARKNK